MLNIKQYLRRSLAVLLSLALLSTIFPSVQANAADTFTIRSVEDFLEFAEKCSLDTWSEGRTVELETDLSLEGADFTPIPVFCGTFNGNGHTISGLNLTGEYSTAGLFRTLQASGKIEDLNVSGTITIDDADAVGGIVGDNYGQLVSCSFTGTLTGQMNTGSLVGINESTGVLHQCTSGGAVYGDSMTGGIAGCNYGLIASCTNSAYINTQAGDKVISLNDINIDLTLDIDKIEEIQSSYETLNAAMDTGGIAGYNSGILLSDVNSAVIGYQHVGYNVGGIAGRSCGYVLHCQNNGQVCGRKDIGGIVGQMEPYISTKLSESTLSKLQDQFGELSTLIDQASSDAEGSVGSVTSRLSSMAGSVQDAMSNVNDIKNSVDDTISQAVGSLTSEDILQDAEEDAQSAASSITENIQNAIGDISDDIGSLDDTTDLTDAIADFTGNLADAADLGDLTNTVNSLSSQISLLNGSVSGTVGTLSSDVQAINDKFNEVSETLSEALSESSTAVISDMSTVDVSLITFGKVSRCLNTASVNGDIDVGGVAGAMAIEQATDPEDDTEDTTTAEYKKQYEMRAIIIHCENTGDIDARRSYTGGIAGRQDLGLISDSMNWGNITSEDNNYVGGIAGLCGSVLRSCYAKCTLKGNDYIGGIAGSGVSEDVSGNSSSISGCYSMVEISGSRYLGAVCGSLSGEFLENYFVSDSLAGIDSISYGGKAEPITYTQLVNTLGTPDEMKTLTLRFVADDVVLCSTDFHYGESFGADVFPEIPEKEGYSAVWDRTDLSTLHFDTTVTAVYTQFVAAISSSDERQSGKPVFFAEGDYTDEQKVSAEFQTSTPSDFAPLSSGVLTAISSYMEENPVYTWFSEPIHGEVLEQWKISVPDDGASSHTIHYLSPDESSDNIEIYLREGEGWIKADSTALGSYQVFTISGTNAEIAVISTVAIWWLWACALVILLAAITILTVCIVRISRRRARRKARRRAKKEAEALKAAGMTPEEAAARAEEMQKQTEQDPIKKKKKKIRLAIVLSSLLVAAAAAAVLIGLILNGRLAPWKAVEDRLLQSEMTMDLTADIACGSGEDQAESHTEATLSRRDVDGNKYTLMTLESVPLYFCNNMIILENGSSYSLGETFSDYSSLLSTLAPLCKGASMSTRTSGNEKIYSFTCSGSSAAEILKLVSPSVGSAVSDTQELNVEITLENRSCEKIALTAEGTLADAALTPFTVSVTLDNFIDSAPFTVPQKVLNAVEQNNAADLSAISDDLFRLICAWSRLEKQDTASADVTLNANCGPVVVSTNLKMYSQLVDDERIYTVNKNGLTVYFNENGIVNANGQGVSSDETSLANTSQLMELIDLLSTGGSFTREASGTTYTYTVTLDGDSIQELADVIAPEASSLDVNYTSGTMVLVLEEDSLTSVTISCSGTIHVVLVDAPVSLSGTITFTDETPEAVPEAAAEALK